MITNENKIKRCYHLLKNWWEMIELNNYEKSFLKNEIVCFNQQLLRLKDKVLRVGVYGKAGVGKSSILNLILEEDYFNTGILNGSTKEIISKEWILKKGLINRVVLIDFPGIDIFATKQVQDNTNNILNLDFILFIISGDMNRNEVNTINLLIRNGKKIIIIFNKIDIWSESEIKQIISNIRKKLINNSDIPIIRSSIKNSKDNHSQYSIRNYLIKTFNTISDTLLIYNTVQIASKLALNIKENRLTKRKKKAQITIGKYATLKASSVVLNPILFFDMFGSFALDTILIKELSKIYGIKFKRESARTIFENISINNIYLGATQVGINISFNLIKKISLLSAPFTHGMSLLPYGPIAIAQAILAIRATKLIGKIAAKEILNKSKLNNLEPFQIIQQFALKELEMPYSQENFLYNQRINKDYSIFIP